MSAKPMPAGWTAEQWRRSQPGPVRGRREVNGLARWWLSRRGKGQVVDHGEEYRWLVAGGVISDNCEWLFDVAEVDCGGAMVALENRWLVELLAGQGMEQGPAGEMEQELTELRAGLALTEGTG